MSDTEELIRLREAVQLARNARVPVELFCPQCKAQHVDQNEWAHEISHRKHLCHACQHVWQPYPVGTVGVDLHIPCREKQDRLETDIAWLRGEWTNTVEDNRLLSIRRDELLAVVANLSQTVPLESEVAEALNQRGALLAEIGTLKATIAEREWTDAVNKILLERNETLVAMITMLQQGIRDVCAIATTPLPEDRQVVIAVGKLAKMELPPP